MKKWELKTSRSFDPKTQKIVGLLAAQLDEQLGALKRHIKDLTVEQLEWQPRPGMNTIGVLLAHLAIAELYWVKVVPFGLRWKPDGEALAKKHFGIIDDGIPLAADGGHPSFLKDFSLARYTEILDKSRRIRNSELKKWRDKGLYEFLPVGKQGKGTRLAMLHHALEHLSSHIGQILMLKHMMSDAGVLVEEE